MPEMKELTWANCKKRARIWISALGANGEPQELQKILVVAIQRVDAALKCAEFMQKQNSDAFLKLVAASNYLAKIADWFEKGEKISENLTAVLQIYEAMKLLEDDQLLFTDSAAAAKAFDQLFIGFGTLAKNFPPPFDQTIGEFLVQCGTLSFFSNMQQTMVGPNSNLGRAAYIRDHME